MVFPFSVGAGWDKRGGGGEEGGGDGIEKETVTKPRHNGVHG
jgi:hypothetical protein